MSDDALAAALSHSRAYIGRVVSLGGSKRSDHVVVEAIDFTSASEDHRQRRSYAVVADSGELVLRGMESGNAMWLFGGVWSFTTIFSTGDAQPLFSVRCRRLIRSRASVRSPSGAMLGQVVSRGRRSGYALEDASHRISASVRGPNLSLGSLEVGSGNAVFAKVSRAADPSMRDRGQPPAAVTCIDFVPEATTALRVLSLATVLLVAFDHADRRWP